MEVLFAVFLGMIPKEEPTLQRLFQAPRLQVVRLPLAPRRRFVTRADLTKYGVTIGCAACSDIALHGKTAKAHTDECRARIGEQMEHDPERHERLQLHKRKRDVELDVDEARAPVVREIAGDPALLEQQDVEMPVEGIWRIRVCEMWSGCWC